MDQHTALVKSVRDVLNTGVSMRGLAKQAGVSHATISKLLSDDAVNVSLKTYQKLMSAAGVEMKTTTIHDHASASLAQIEQAALDRGIKADIGLRDTELECAKYRRMMSLEAELDVWQLKCGKERSKSEQLQYDLNRCQAIEHRVTKDLQVMSASWKAVSVERDNLERCITQREQHLKSCEKSLVEVNEKCKTQQLLIELRDAQIALNKNAALIAERESKRLIDKAKSQRNACQVVAFFAVVCMFLIAFGGCGMKSRTRKPKQAAPKLLVKRMWFKLDDLYDPAVDFYEVAQGDLEADRKTCVAKELWRINHAGWWSFTLTFYGYDDDHQTGERAINFRPEVMLTPKTIIQRVKESFDSFIEANDGFNAVGSMAMVTISNRKPISVYGDAV